MATRNPPAAARVILGPRGGSRMSARSKVLAAATCAVLGAAGVVVAGGPSKAELKEALKDDVPVGDWIYDDIDAGLARAAKEKRPLCVVFR
jgi:hypothetical protein